jgi:hypothetical protein
VSFLAPLYLLFAAGVAVPLVLHLMRRRIDLRVDFPAARYLLRAERENIRQLRLRNLLLMMLRVLALVLLALAAARPVGRAFGTGHAPTAMAIVLDNSLSTSVVVDGAPLLTRLRTAARDLLDDVVAADRVWLVTVDGQVVGGSKQAVGEAIDRTDVLGGRGDLSAAATRAAGLVLSSGLPARVVAIVTDAQATALPVETSLGNVRVVVYAPETTPPLNHAVVLADPRPGRWTPRGGLVARASGPDSATYRVTLGTRTLARGTARPGEELIVRAAPPDRGWLAGSVELEPDELRGDDVRHFAVWVGTAPAVRVEASAGEFARTAVEALVQSERAQLGDGIWIGPADQAPKLPALLLAPSDPVRLGAANRALERLGIPWRFDPPRRDRTVVRGDRFDGTNVSLYYPLNAQAGAVNDTLASAAGNAWIVAGAGYVLVGSPLDPNATDLPVRAGFVPWLGDVVGQRLAGDAGALFAATPGGAVRISVESDGLEGPDGQVVPLTQGTVRAPARAGVYFLRRGAERVGALVVNGEPQESDLRRLSAQSLGERLRGSNVTVLRDGAEWRRAAFDAGARRPLSTPLLLLALAALLAELIVVRRGDRVLRPRAA